jgi:hypothetical protein
LLPAPCGSPLTVAARKIDRANDNDRSTNDVWFRGSTYRKENIKDIDWRYLMRARTHFSQAHSQERIS